MVELRKVIISCAVTGSIHTPTMSPHLPITPRQIAESAIEAVQAGAAILHLPTREPETGCLTPSPDVHRQFLPPIKAATDGVRVAIRGIEVDGRRQVVRHVPKDVGQPHRLLQNRTDLAGWARRRVRLRKQSGGG